jgi:hypothetical protein
MALNQVGLERLNTATTKKIGASKNLIINGAMLVAQRGTSSTSQDYQTVDRFKSVQSGIDEVANQSQVDVASGTTPYTLGFRKAYKLENGNQTSGAGAGDLVKMMHRVEAQNIANSGWNYLSSSSYMTISFWVKSSVSQNFYVQLIAYDNAAFNYTFETGSLTADTWTKVTHSIPGNSNIRFDNDFGLGLEINWIQFGGTDRTSSGFALNTWAAYASGSQSPDMTSTWYTTNNATFELTGVQLEVGTVATDFEHRIFADEERLCKRYFQRFTKATHSQTPFIGHLTSGVGIIGHVFSQVMRDTPTVSQANNFNVYTASTNNVKTNLGIEAAPQGFRTLITSMTGTNGDACQIDFENNTLLDFSAEL